MSIFIGVGCANRIAQSDFRSPHIKGNSLENLLSIFSASHCANRISRKPTHRETSAKRIWMLNRFFMFIRWNKPPRKSVRAKTMAESKRTSWKESDLKNRWYLQKRIEKSWPNGCAKNGLHQRIDLAIGELRQLTISKKSLVLKTDGIHCRKFTIGGKTAKDTWMIKTHIMFLTLHNPILLVERRLQKNSGWKRTKKSANYDVSVWFTWGWNETLLPVGNWNFLHDDFTPGAEIFARVEA